MGGQKIPDTPPFGEMSILGALIAVEKLKKNLGTPKIHFSKGILEDMLERSRKSEMTSDDTSFAPLDRPRSLCDGAVFLYSGLFYSSR